MKKHPRFPGGASLNAIRMHSRKPNRSGPKPNWSGTLLVLFLVLAFVLVVVDQLDFVAHFSEQFGDH